MNPRQDCALIIGAALFVALVLVMAVHEFPLFLAMDPANVSGGR